MPKTSRFEMRIDPDLLEAVDRARGGVPRSLFVTDALRMAVADPTARAKAERDARVAERQSVSPSLQRFMDGQS